MQGFGDWMTEDDLLIDLPGFSFGFFWLEDQSQIYQAFLRHMILILH